MDNQAFQQNEQNSAAKTPRRPLARANSTLSATTRPWGLTQAARPQLCRCNSVLAPSPSNCQEPPDNNSDSTFFAKKSPTKNILMDNTLWTKEFWSDTYSRLHDTSPAFQKFPSVTSGVSAIYDPQFLSSKLSYSGSQQQHSAESNKPQKEWLPGLGAWDWGCGWGTHAPANRAAAIFCALMLTLLATGNVLYILRTVEKPPEHLRKGTWVDVVLITGEFKITNEPYRLSLANHTSEDFQRLSSRISHQLDSLFALSVVSEPYHSTAVTQLLPGLLVRCQIVLRAATRLTATKVGLAFIGGLRNQHGHMWLGNFSVDIQSIGFQASGDAVSWTSWSEWGFCQYTQEFGYVQIRSRNCTLRSGQYLYSTLPCLLVPHSHGNIETAPCLAPTIPVRDEIVAAESEVMFSRTMNHTSRSEKIVNIVKVTRTNCTGNKTELEEKVADISDSKRQQLIKNTSTSLEARGLCVCVDGEVCVARQEHETPRCLPVLDSSDPTGCGGHCQINTQLCQKIQGTAFRCVDDTQCLDDEWQCGNQLCIPQSKRCDGHFNCYDHTDEFNCDCLGVDQFTCNDSQCIPNHRFCDGFPDCNDHSDEPFGCGGECKTHEWKCRNSRCIPQSKRCDSVDDCGDDSDEMECPTLSPE